MDLQKGFKPERWLAEDTQPSTFFAFGGGPRLCVGMNLALAEIKILLALLTRRCDMELLDTSTALDWSAFPKPASGVPLRIVPRKL